MIFRIRSPKGIFGQNMSDLRNGSLTGVSRSYQSATLKSPALSCKDFSEMKENQNYNFFSPRVIA